MQLAPGDLFADRYRVVRSIGRGGMGAVYEARDLALGEEIALKLLALGDSPPPLAVLRFREEVRLGRRVTGRNVARVYDVGEVDEQLFLTMELVVGETLRDRLRRDGALSVLEALRVGAALARGLEVAHDVGVVHRDLKPPNVLLEQDTGRVVITDFGIALSLTAPSDLTEGVVGTRRYMAPEQAVGAAVDTRADLYALGVVLTEMLTGRVPQELERGVSAALDRVELGPSLRALVLGLLELDPARRLGRARDVALALEAAVPSAPAAAPGPARVEPALAQERESESLAPRPVGELPERADARLVVLPFRFMGPAEHSAFAATISQEIASVLTASRGLRVVAAAPGADGQGARDAVALGMASRADAVVDGRLQMLGDRGRLTARLVSVLSGAVLWADHIEGTLSDFWSFQATIARRVAEALRLELSVQSYGASDEVVRLYTGAKAALRAYQFPSEGGVLASLERCIELAPTFGPAYAAHALATSRAWFDLSSPSGIDWSRIAGASVARAETLAPELSETHHAAAVLAQHRGDFAGAVRAIARALSIAPHSAQAQELLGILECETRFVHRGVARLRAAYELDATLALTLIGIAREYALAGQVDYFRRTLAALRPSDGGVISRFLRCRVAGWYRDEAELARLASSELGGGGQAMEILRTLVAVLRQEMPTQALEVILSRASEPGRSPRGLALMRQLCVEVAASRGDLALARRELVRLLETPFIDVQWLERCPPLQALRWTSDFARVHAETAARADAMWRDWHRAPGPAR